MDIAHYTTGIRSRTFVIFVYIYIIYVGRSIGVRSNSMRNNWPLRNCLFKCTLWVPKTINEFRSLGSWHCKLYIRVYGGGGGVMVQKPSKRFINVYKMFVFRWPAKYARWKSVDEPKYVVRARFSSVAETISDKSLRSVT